MFCLGMRIQFPSVLVAAWLTTVAISGAADKTPVWTDPANETIPASFALQGEDVGEIKGGGKLGAHVIALGGDDFQAVFYTGGLPGAGWDGENRSLLAGVLKDDKVAFTPADGNRKYLGKSAGEFSASQKYPPKGHQKFTGEISGDTFSGKSEDGKAFSLKKETRVSKSMGAKPPKSAIVLFDGTNQDAFNGGRLDEDTKFLNTDGRDIRTKEKFNNYKMHVEFMLPYRPDARGQGRGNSGFYQVDHYEVQILDSFGLEGVNNECGGVYKNASPIVNMCLPPLTWQTYDIEFTNAVVEDGEKKSKARITLHHNGVLICKQ